MNSEKNAIIVLWKGSECMKKMNLCLVFFVVVLLTSCKSSNLNLKLVVYNKSDIAVSAISVRGDEYIKTYDEYLELINDNSIDLSYDSDYFEDNSLFLFKTTSNKSPSYKIESFSINDHMLDINLLQESSLVRSIDSQLLDSTFIVFVEINSKDIVDVEYHLFEDNSYFAYDYIYLYNDYLELENKDYVFTDYNQFEEIFKDNTALNNIVSEDLFLNNNLFLTITNNVPYGNYILPIDFYGYTDNDKCSVEAVFQTQGYSVSLIDGSMISIVTVEKNQTTCDVIEYESTIVNNR